MCGIYGFFDRDGSEPGAAVLEAMGDVLAHRGPDDVGVAHDRGIALGNRRLSIIDIAGGHQPFVSEDGNIVVVQNGEIFNHVELARELASSAYRCRTHSDTEVILRLYQRDGIGMIERLNGMFAIAILDKRERTLYLVRDRVGVKPLYFHDDGRRLVFASEIKALFHAGVRPGLDPLALHDYLTYNFVPQPRTIFAGVEHLPPGHVMRVDERGRGLRRWWKLTEQRADGFDEAGGIGEFNELFEDAVRLRLRCDVPFGAFLSGGIDSSSVVGMMSRCMDEPVSTYSIGFHEARFDESAYAAETARRFGTRHRMEKVNANMLDLWPLALWHCDQPHGDISFLPTYRVAELAARDVKVVLTGDGADEMFAGYDKYRDFFASPALADLDEDRFRRAYFANMSLFDNERKAALYSDGFGAGLAGVDSFDTIAPLFDEARDMDRINQVLYIDMQHLLSGNNLVKPDRMGMAVSLEARTPFLDYRLMELAFRVPGEYKLRDGETKYLLKKAVADLVGPEIAYRRKQMFTVPVGEWFRDSLAGYSEALLLGERALDRGWFRREFVRGLLRDHQSGAANHTREIRALIAVELWARNFLDAAVPSKPAVDEWPAVDRVAT